MLRIVTGTIIAIAPARVIAAGFHSRRKARNPAAATTRSIMFPRTSEPSPSAAPNATHFQPALDASPFPPEAGPAAGPAAPGRGLVSRASDQQRIVASIATTPRK